MPFANVLDLANDIATLGNNWQSFFFKTGGPIAGAGRWADASVGAGTPVYNAYPGAPLEAAQLVGAGNRGIYTGPAPSAGQTKHLHAIDAATSSAAVPLYLLLADYLLYYPLVDGDSTDEQELVNGATLPRYATGEGVRLMVVCAAPMVQNALCTITYTNHAGVENRTATFAINSSTIIGGIVNCAATTSATSAETPFAPLANGDRGIRSIQKVAFSAAVGGLVNFVLVRPIAHVQIREQNTEAEKILFTQGATAPQIFDGAYLNFIVNNATASAYANLRGYLSFAWS